ncbi:MAG: choice-of-anchor A family protein [Phycisphaerae bacterium]|nr:choice-of-anchor A family protein [Phycisphaerae bacterium]
MKTAVRAVVLVMVLLLSQPALADAIDPFDYFSVYSLGDIGTSGRRFQATFSGTAGAAGNVHLSSSSILPASTAGYALHVGGDLSAQYSTTFGGLTEAGGQIGMNGVIVRGDLHAGGSISDFGWGGATIQGSAYAAGTVTFSNRVSVQGTHAGAPYESHVDHQVVSACFRDTSSYIGGLSSTGSVNNYYGNLIFTGQSGLNVVEIDQQTLRNAWGFTIIAPEDSVVLINVLDTTVSLDNTTWVLQGGIERQSVLLNMPHAVNLTLSQTNAVNILAPWATTEFLQGNVDGMLVVGNLYGGGHVTGGGTFDASTVPEPATLSMLVLGGLALLWRRRA